MPIDDTDIQWLLSLVEDEDLAEIEVHVGDQELMVRRTDAIQAPFFAAGAIAAAPADPSQAVEAELPENVVAVTSPMAGVFYRAASPDAPPYVDVDQEVAEGDTVGLVEAMKLFNDVLCPASGVVKKILVEDQESVEAGRTLILIET